MKETDKQYYTRRGVEERNHARRAATAQAQSIHRDLADLCHERANGSANVNGKTGIKGENTPAVHQANDASGELHHFRKG